MTEENKAPALEISGVSKSFGRSKMALYDVHLSVEHGRILCLLGPSGSGKTTLLNVIAGLEEPTKGDVLVDGKSLRGVSPKDRNVGYVFQTTKALFPHLTVYENIAFPLRLRQRHTAPALVPGLVNKIADLVRLRSFLRYYPEKLSGGECQRVAIARALVYNPSLLLLDEPLSSLDNILKRDLMETIFEIREQLRPTIVYVTHDDREALELADEVAILDEGRLLQVGTTREVALDPVSGKAAQIIGGWNVLAADCTEIHAGATICVCRAGFTLEDHPRLPAGKVNLGVPTSAIKVIPIEHKSIVVGQVEIDGRLQRVVPWYGMTMAHVACGSIVIRVETAAPPSGVGSSGQVRLCFPKSAMKVWTA
jgi:putative spermidine/putrescine transport system ATP-binding protein